VGGDPARQVEASITDEARRVLDSGRAWDLEERSLAQIVDAYVVMLYDLEQDPEFSASPDGPLWREEVVAFEEGLRIEVSKHPLQGAELFMRALHSEEPDARLLVAHCADVLAWIRRCGRRVLSGAE